MITALLKLEYSYLMFRELYGSVNLILLTRVAVIDLLLTIGLIFYVDTTILTDIRSLAIVFGISEGAYRFYLLGNLLGLIDIYWDMAWFLFQGPSVIVIGVILHQLASCYKSQDGRTTPVIQHRYLRQSIESIGFLSIFIGSSLILIALFPTFVFLIYLFYLTIYTITVCSLLIITSILMLKGDLDSSDELPVIVAD